MKRATSMATSKATAEDMKRATSTATSKATAQEERFDG
jgi:hypothetical protein